MADVYVRPIRYGERRYVWSTTRSAIKARNGGDWCDFETVAELVDGMLERCRISAAFIDGMEENGRLKIQGFVVEDPGDDSVEFLHIWRLYKDMQSQDLGARVVSALLRNRAEVTFRRSPGDAAAVALGCTRCVVKVKPRSV
jgi:hypothetical protein